MENGFCGRVRQTCRTYFMRSPMQWKYAAGAADGARSRGKDFPCSIAQTRAEEEWDEENNHSDAGGK